MHEPWKHISQKTGAEDVKHMSLKQAPIVQALL